MEGRTLSHYRILEKIGTGGMGVVYRAHDDRLDRDVAMKVLPAGLLGNEEARRRFRKEALALSRLNHPNIETVHDFDTQEGLDFLVMEYIPGETLDHRLAAGALQERDVARLGVQIAQGLAAAHTNGVAHRDLKPANLRLTPDGRLKILDFGLAKLFRPLTDKAVTQTLTEEHGAIGTLPYMAPEQVRAEPIDARTDIYALGVVLYEMACGQRPFREETASRLTDAILHQQPVSPRALKMSVSPELERVILKCLEKDPGDRYQSSLEVGVDLRRAEALTAGTLPHATPRAAPRQWLPLGQSARALTILLSVVVLVFAGYLVRQRLRPRARPPVGKIMLAILPFDNLSGDPEQEYFSDGLTEEMITQLGRLHPERLGVIARTSVMRYKKTDKGIDQIGRELGVDYVLEGSVRRAGNRVRIAAQLIQGSDQTHLWADSYERDLRDILTLQSDLAQGIARQIQLKLTPHEQHAPAAIRPVNPEAYETYLKGRHHSQQNTRDELVKGIGYYEQAIQEDPDYALAYAALGHAYGMLSFLEYLPASDGMKKMRAATRRAFELDPSLAEAHVNFADEDFYFDWDWSGGEAGFRRAVELDPGSVDVVMHYALCLEALGRYEDAIQEMERARLLDPLAPWNNASLGAALYNAGQDERAIAQYRKVIELDPNDASAYESLGEVYEDIGKYEEAVTVHLKARSLAGDGAERVQALRDAYGAGGMQGYWRKRLEHLKETAKREHISPITMASVYARLGEKDQALEWLEKAYQQRSGRLAWLKADRVWNPLRSDPRFRDLLRRMKLASD